MGYHLGVSQFDSSKWLIFNSTLTKFVLGGSGGIKFVILVEDFDTDSPSSISVRKKYLFAFQFWF